MSRSADPVLPRMPGSAIIAVVFLGLQAIVCLYAGIFFFSIIPPGIALLLCAAGVLNATITIGVARRRRWARMTGIVLCAVSIAIGAIDFLVSASAGVPSDTAPVFGISIALLYLLSQRNTRAWCNDLASAETTLGPADPEPFMRRDRVELLEDVEEAGLRAYTVGTVVELPIDPGSVVVEFDDHPDREPVQVTLRTDQIGLVHESD